MEGCGDAASEGREEGRVVRAVLDQSREKVSSRFKG